MKPDLKAATGVLTTAAEMVIDVIEAAQTAADAMPEHIQFAIDQTESARDRLVGVLQELRGIGCDFEVVGHYLEGEPTRPGWLDIDPDMSRALVTVVDLLTTAQFGLDRLRAWKPEEATE